MNQTATDLVNRFKMVLMNENTKCGNEILCTTIAKQCALICVDEALTFEIKKRRRSVETQDNINYYTQLKSEIQKL